MSMIFRITTFIMTQYEKITETDASWCNSFQQLMQLDGNGVADAVAKMAFGNKTWC